MARRAAYGPGRITTAVESAVKDKYHQSNLTRIHPFGLYLFPRPRRVFTRKVSASCATKISETPWPIQHQPYKASSPPYALYIHPHLQTSSTSLPFNHQHSFIIPTHTLTITFNSHTVTTIHNHNYHNAWSNPREADAVHHNLRYFFFGGL